MAPSLFVADIYHHRGIYSPYAILVIVKTPYVSCAPLVAGKPRFCELGTLIIVRNQYSIRHWLLTAHDTYPTTPNFALNWDVVAVPVTPYGTE